MLTFKLGTTVLHFRYVINYKNQELRKGCLAVLLIKKDVMTQTALRKAGRL